MERNKDIETLLEDICRSFPEIRPLMDEFEEFATSDRMEAFAKATTQAFSRNGIPKSGEGYLNFMSNRLRSCSSEERNFIDVYYAEVLFWSASDETIRLGWPLVPQNIKDLYLQFHGKPPHSGN